MTHSDESGAFPRAMAAAVVSGALGWFIGFKQGYDSGVLVGYGQCLEKLTRAAMTAVGR